MSIELQVGKESFKVEQFTFPGGEVQIKVPEAFGFHTEFDVYANIRNSDDVMALILTMSVVGRPYNSHINLHMHYFPYARQDRACQVGEAESFKVFANIINQMHFASVHIFDLHNEEMLQYIDNVEHTPQEAFTKGLVFNYRTGALPYDYIVSPDKGALPKVERLLNLIPDPEFRPKVIVGEKVRDPTTGEITHTAIDFNGSLAGQRLLILDDICDGGRTFVELAKVLKKHRAYEIDLFVTHGIFSKGTKVFEGLIDNIYTTSSFFDNKLRPEAEQYQTIFNIPVYVYKGSKFTKTQGV